MAELHGTCDERFAAVRSPWAVDQKVCFWGGWGGSVIIMDASRRVTISYMMNKMGAGVVGSARSSAYSQAIYRAIRG